MLKLNYREETFCGSHMEIVPYKDEEIRSLRLTVLRELRIENPQVTFAKKMEDGQFDGVPENIVAQEAGVCLMLSKLLWGEDSYANNALYLLSKAMQVIVDYAGKDYFDEGEKES